MKKYIPPIASEREKVLESGTQGPISVYFGENTFNLKIMKDRLPGEVFGKLRDIINENLILDIETANAVAHAMKEWALEKGATHFAHWFQPMTGATAEKHDAFIEFVSPGEVIERFSGKQLVQGEPDASSFPSGGLRATFEARGYTAWDISSPAFIRRNGLATTLCIPCAFISYTGEALDKKTPLLRSLKAINKSAIRMLKILGNNQSKRVICNLGPEQEYFLIDTDFFHKRQDLLLTGRALLGAPPAKGQELEDQYFGSIKERIQSFMHDVEEEMYRLGIPAKTRHNEVAPSQFEVAPIFEEANIAVDHNLLMMDTLHKTAKKHRLAALLHEKPFAGVNGSGKHLNWSLADDRGNNLFNPGATPSDNIQFLVFLTATIRAVYRHGDILRASVASAGNDHRLGANEAPPAIISVFLGEQLARILGEIEQGVVSVATDSAIIDLGISSIPQLSRDTSDRNRTSPFAFTGNKFEFRAPGASQSISFPAAVLNTIVSESLDDLADVLELKMKDAGSGDIKQVILDVLREELHTIKAVLYMGDNYSAEWENEAVKRGLPNLKTSPDAFPALVTHKALHLFEKFGVLRDIELQSRYAVRLEKYCAEMEIESRALSTLASTGVVPAAVRYQDRLARAIERTVKVLGSDLYVTHQRDLLKEITSLINVIISLLNELKEKLERAETITDLQLKAHFYCDEIKKDIRHIRHNCDTLETLIDEELWPMPKLWEILFIS